MINFALSDELSAMNRRLGRRLAAPRAARVCSYF